MKSYNLELEEGLRSRPLPMKQVELSMEQITARSKRSIVPKRIFASVAVCAAILASVWIVQSTRSHESAIPQTADTGSPMTEGSIVDGIKMNAGAGKEGVIGDWIGEWIDYSGNIPESGESASFESWLAAYYEQEERKTEVLYIDHIREDYKLVFVVRPEKKYPYNLGLDEFEWEWDRQSGSWGWRVGARFAGQLKRDRYEVNHDHADAFSHGWFGTETVPFLYGTIKEPAADRIQLVNDEGAVHPLDTLLDSQGNRYWYTSIPETIDQYSIYMEAVTKEGEILIKRHIGGNIVD